MGQNFHKDSRKAAGKIEDSRWVYDFKRNRKHTDEVKAAIDAIAQRFQCADVVAVPGHTPALNALQELLGQRSSAQPRLTPANTTAKASATARNMPARTASTKTRSKAPAFYLVDDVCKTGATLNHFTGALQRAGFEVVRLALGLNYKLPTQPVDASAAPLAALPQALPAQPPKDALLLDKISALSEIGSTPEDAATSPWHDAGRFHPLAGHGYDARQRWNKGRLEAINQLSETLHKHALSGSVQAAKFLLENHIQVKQTLDQSEELHDAAAGEFHY